VQRFRPTVAIVDLDAIRHNVRALTPDGSEVMAVVKANGYGHGDVETARAAVEGGATWLGVALVEEGLRLREAGLTAPVLVLTEFPPGSEKEALSAGLTPSLYTGAGLTALAEAARTTGSPNVGVHVKLDTGLHRVGLDPERGVPFVRRLTEEGLEFEALWTHFAKADQPFDPYLARQVERFDAATEALAAQGFRPRLRHVANSAAIMAGTAKGYELVRLGVALYGLAPSPEVGRGNTLEPALTWRSAVSMVKRLDAGESVSYGLRYTLDRPSTIATIPVGYADGYSRRLSNAGHVLIRGRRYPVAGTVCMDQILADCGDDPVEAGDEVVLLGPQGDDAITADEIAGLVGTINYEVVCGIGPRVPREYVG
jgi:alanine racemase